VPEAAPPRVFISYSHDSAAHRDRVLRLADRLRVDGVDASIDQYEQSPPQGWPAWCEAEIDNARFVLMVCTETYLRRAKGEVGAGKGHGVLWEARLIKQHLYGAGSVSDKFVPVLFADGTPEHVPMPVRGASSYRVETPEGYEALLRLLFEKPLTPKGPIGKPPPLPPKPRRSSGSGKKPSRLAMSITAAGAVLSLLFVLVQVSTVGPRTIPAATSPDPTDTHAISPKPAEVAASPSPSLGSTPGLDHASRPPIKRSFFTVAVPARDRHESELLEILTPTLDPATRNQVLSFLGASEHAGDGTEPTRVLQILSVEFDYTDDPCPASVAKLNYELRARTAAQDPAARQTVQGHACYGADGAATTIEAVRRAVNNLRAVLGM